MTRSIGPLVCLLGSVAAAQQYVISTFAGGVAPPTSAVALNAAIGTPVGVTTDLAGNVYFVSADLGSVFKLGQDGSLTLVAGGSKASYLGDGGPATSAAVDLTGLIGGARPGGLAVDNARNLFIADASHNPIRRVSPSGLIVTVAGIGGTQGFSGDGGPASNAQLAYPTSVAVDASGNLFIADTGNRRIRKVSTSGIITTVAGNGQCCFSGNGGPATDAALAAHVVVGRDLRMLCRARYRSFGEKDGSEAPPRGANFYE